MGSFPETYNDQTWSKRKFLMRKEFNPLKFSLIHRHGRCFIVLHTSVATMTLYKNDQSIWIWRGTEALIGQLHDDVILLQPPESSSLLFSCAN